MSPKQQDMWNVTTEYFWRTRQAMNSIMQDESGVTSIEYALLAVLIAVFAVAGIGAAGSALTSTWSGVASAVSAAV